MEYKKCSIAGHIYDPDREKSPVLTHKDLVDNLVQGRNSPEMIREFLTLLTVCHTVIPEQDKDGNMKKLNDEVAGGDPFVLYPVHENDGSCAPW